MSPTTTGSAGAVIHDHPHIALPTRPRHQDLDPWERIERAQSRRAIQSPIKLRELDAEEEARLERETAPEPPPRKPSKRTTKRKDQPERSRRNEDRRTSAIRGSTSVERDHALREQIAALAGQGSTSTDIALELAIAPSTVRRHAKAAGIALPRPSGKSAEHVWVDTAVELARAGHTATEIAQQVGASSHTVRKVLRSRGVSATDGRHRPGPRKTPADVVENVVALYTGEERPSPPQIARQVGIMPRTVRMILDREGIPRRDARADHSGGTKMTPQATPAQLQQLYSDLGTIKAVAQQLGIGQTTAGRLLRAAGVRLRTASEVQKGRPGRDGGARSLAQELTAAGVSAAQVRAWARDADLPIAAVGLPSKMTWQAYQATHPTSSTTAPWPAARLSQYVRDTFPAARAV